MNEEEKQVESEQEEGKDGNAYIEALKEMKQKSVSRESYEKLKSENKKLLDALVNGETVEAKKEEEKVDVNKLRKELFNKDSQLSNIEYVEKALKLRKSILENDGRDPFLPIGQKVDLTPDQIEKANAVAEVLQECVDFAEGDSGIFTAELQRRTKDTIRYGRNK